MRQLPVLVDAEVVRAIESRSMRMILMDRANRVLKSRQWLTDGHSACIPALLLAGANAYNLWNQHWEHWSHMPPLEERTEYPYQNIRTKNFTWGDGDKTLL